MLCSGLNEGTTHPSGEDSITWSGDDVAAVAQNGKNLTEWGKTSLTEEHEWGHASVSQSDSWAMSTTWDMQLDSPGEQGCRLESID